MAGWQNRKLIPERLMNSDRSNCNSFLQDFQGQYLAERIQRDALIASTVSITHPWWLYSPAYSVCE